MNGLKRHIYVESPDTSIYLDGNNLLFKNKNGVNKISIDDVECLFLNETGASISVKAINKCIENNVLIITLDKKHNPYSQSLPINFSHNSFETISKQIKWKDNRKRSLINKILINKFKMQSSCLKENKIEDPIKQFDFQDKPALLEGVIAKIYFKKLFGDSFNRNDENNINPKLNYGYSIIVSYINRIVVAHGYLTSIGIFHCSKCNNFNLTYDLFEPFRPIIDLYVYLSLDEIFDYKYKTKISEILDIEVYVDSKKYQLRDAIEKHVINCINYLNSKTDIYEDISFNG